MNLFRKALPLMAACATLTFGKASQVVNTTDGSGNITHQTFNQVISVYRSVPQSERALYEDIIKHWADAIYEASNGAHTLGRIEIYENGNQGAIANVLWNEDEWPRAAVGGFITDGYPIIIGDDWTMEYDDGSTETWEMLSTARLRQLHGYTLAHEFGHNVYHLYDQYAADQGTANSSPHADDTESDPSIMAQQSYTIGYGSGHPLVNTTGNWEYLNFDTQDRYIADNAQGRMWGLSGWGLLTSPAGQSYADLTAAPYRVHYPALNGAEPTAGDTWTNPHTGDVHNFMSIQMPTAAGRDNLEIVWMGEDIEVELIVDNSGSMSSVINGRKPMDDVKNAAKWLIDGMKEGETVAGISRFSATAANVSDMTELPSPDAGEKQVLKNAIDGIGTMSTTALFDGALFGLNKLEAYKTANGTNARRVAMLLTDGRENSSSATMDEVVDAYTDAGVSLFTFGYGRETDHDQLRSLSSQTGGEYSANLQTANEVSDAFMNVYADAAGIPTSASTDFTTNNSCTFSVDASQTEFIIDVDYTLEDSAAFCQFVLKDNAGNVIPVNPADIVIKGRVQDVFPSIERATILLDQSQVQGFEKGDWTLEIVTSGAVSQDAHLTVRGFTEGRTYDLFAGSINGPTVTYPEPMLLYATITKGSPLTNVSVAAAIESPSGAIDSVVLYDDGTHGDQHPEDGIYATVYTGYAENGDYTFSVNVSNPSQNAVEARFQNVNIARDTIAEKFSRARSYNIVVSGVSADDHSNEIVAATEYTAMDTKVAGTFETVGDVDCFKISNFATDRDLTIRITEMLNVSPVITVYAQDGVTQLASKALSSDKNQKGYLYVNIPQNQLGDELYVVIGNENSTTGGIYYLSAGTVTHTDVALWVQPEGAHDCYNTGDIINYNGAVYQSLVEGNVWAPVLAPNLWKLLAGGRYPSHWVSPTGAHNSYNINAQTIHRGVVYESTIDGNVWEPSESAFGWKIAQ